MRSSEKDAEGAIVADEWVVIAEREGVVDRFGQAMTECEQGQNVGHGEKQISSISYDFGPWKRQAEGSRQVKIHRGNGHRNHIL